MVNDSPSNFANAAMKRVVLRNEIYLCLYAMKQISKGTEIRYDYGEDEDIMVWRNFKEFLHPYSVTETKEGWTLLDIQLKRGDVERAAETDIPALHAISSSPKSVDVSLKKVDEDGASNSLVNGEADLPAVHGITATQSKDMYKDQKTSSSPKSVDVSLKKVNVDGGSNSLVNGKAKLPAVHGITATQSKDMYKDQKTSSSPTSVQDVSAKKVDVDTVGISSKKVEADLQAVHVITTNNSKDMYKDQKTSSHSTSLQDASMKKVDLDRAGISLKKGEVDLQAAVNEITSNSKDIYKDHSISSNPKSVQKVSVNNVNKDNSPVKGPASLPAVLVITTNDSKDRCKDQKTSSSPKSVDVSLKKVNVNGGSNSLVNGKAKLPAVHGLTTTKSKDMYKDQKTSSNPTSVQDISVKKVDVDNSPVKGPAALPAVLVIRTNDSKDMHKDQMTSSNSTLVQVKKVDVDRTGNSLNKVETDIPAVHAITINDSKDTCRDRKTSSSPKSVDVSLKKVNVDRGSNSLVNGEANLPAVRQITTSNSKDMCKDQKTSSDPKSVQKVPVKNVNMDNSPVKGSAGLPAVHLITTNDSMDMYNYQKTSSNPTLTEWAPQNKVVFDSDSDSDAELGCCENLDALVKKICHDNSEDGDRLSKIFPKSEVHEKFIPDNALPIYINIPSLENFVPVCSSPVSTTNDDVDFGISANVSFDLEDPFELTIPQNDSGIAVEKSLEIINSDNEIGTNDNNPSIVVGKNETPKKPIVKGKNKKPARPCQFCNTLQTRLKRHILSKHKQHELVLPLLTMNAKEQDRIIDTFRKNGIRKNNLDIAEKGEESFMRERKSKGDELPVMCSGCKGFFSKSYKPRHQLVCPANGSNFMIPVVSIDSSAVTDQHSDSFKALLNTLQIDEVSNYIKTDEIILMIGSRSFAAVQRKADKKTEAKKSVRARMRLIARLYFEFRKLYGQQSNIMLESKMNNVGDMYRREAITILGEAVVSMCEKPNADAVEEGSNDCVTNLKSGLMISILNMLKLTSKFLIGHFLVQNADAKSKRVVDFLEVLRLYEHDYFDAAYYEINHRRNTTLRKPASLPKDSDVQALTQECKKVMSSIDVYDFDSKVFISVRSAVATTLIMFNARRGGEPVRLRIKQWEEALKGEWVERVNQEEELNEEAMLVTYQTGKGANHLVPVMFPPETLSAMKYLVDPEVRKQAGVRESNCYIFATMQSDNHASGWHCINEMLKRLSLSGAINATSNRHRVASMLAKLELSSKEKELIYQHFGHSGNINQNVYQAAAGTLQLETTGKRLIQIQGRECANDSSQNVSVLQEKTPTNVSVQQKETPANVSMQQKKTLKQDRKCSVQEPSKKRKLHQNNSSEKENCHNLALKRKYSKRERASKEKKLHQNNSSEKENCHNLALKRNYPKRKRSSKVNPSDEISSSDEKDPIYEPCSEDANEFQDAIQTNQRQRPYTIWSDSSKKAFEKEFGDFVKRDFGYPSRPAMELFARNHCLQYQQIRTRIVNERRIRVIKTKALKKKIGV